MENASARQNVAVISMIKYSHILNILCTVINDPDPNAIAKAEWNANCGVWGLTPEAFGKTISMSDGTKHVTYTICGWRIGRRSNSQFFFAEILTAKFFGTQAVRMALIDGY